MARQQRMHHRAVHQAGVVGRDHRARAGGGKVFEALHFEAVEIFEQQHGEVLHALAAPGAQYKDHRREIAKSGEREDGGG